MKQYGDFDAYFKCKDMDIKVASCYVDLYNQLSDDNYAADYNLYASMKAASDDVVMTDIVRMIGV